MVGARGGMREEVVKDARWLCLRRRETGWPRVPRRHPKATSSIRPPCQPPTGVFVRVRAACAARVAISGLLRSAVEAGGCGRCGRWRRWRRVWRRQWAAGHADKTSCPWRGTSAQGGCGLSRDGERACRQRHLVDCAQGAQPYARQAAPLAAPPSRHRRKPWGLVGHARRRRIQHEWGREAG